MRYTQAQQRAIDTRGRNILVAAAAGSGKTRVLVDRIIKQILSGNCGIEEMLVVTFTNAAATEMRERIEKALERELEREMREGKSGKRAERIERQMILLTGASICTFHAFCQQVIRAHIESIDVDPQFRLASDQEVSLLQQDVLERLFEEAYCEPEEEEARLAWQEFLDFVDAYGNEKGDQNVYDAVLRLYKFAQSQPFPKAWISAQQARYAWEEDRSIWDSPWTKIMADEALARLDSCLAAYSDCQIVRETESDASLLSAWKPYREWLDVQIGTVESVRAVLLAARESRTAKSWDNVHAAMQGAKITTLKASKKYAPFKQDFETLRHVFDARRDAAKQLLEDAKKKYFTETEEEVRAHICLTGRTVRAYARLTASFIDAYQAAKREQNILDFNDLEHGALAILCADSEAMQKLLAGERTNEAMECVRSEVARELQAKYAVIMVDEYQDTNSVQEAILDLIARETNRFTVGDVKQSIYRFRLADPALFQKKYDAYPEELEAVTRDQLITMRENFRSRADVLMPINFIFDQVMRRDVAEIDYDERSRLRAGFKYPPHAHSLAGPVELDLILKETEDAGHDAAVPEIDADEQSRSDVSWTGAGHVEDLAGFALEAQHIADRIASLMEEGYVVYDKDLGEVGGYRPLALRDISVLLRATKGKEGVLLRTLQENGIDAYSDADGGYFEVTEVRLMLALLTILDNTRQDIPLAAILVSPIGGFSMEELAKLRLCAVGDLYDALLASFGADSRLEGGLAARAAAFQEQLAAWRTYAMRHSVPDLIWKLYRDTGYYDYVGSLHGGVLRQANLRMLASRAADYEKTNYRGLFRFLRYIDNLKKRNTDLASARALGSDEDVVRIMSIHRSKGLEFPVVILADMAKKFNLQDAQGTFLLHKELGIAPKLVEQMKEGRQRYTTLSWRAVAAKIAAETKAEEMRILYVAMTRARERLILVGSMSEKKWEANAAKWCRTANCPDERLPADMVRSANTYLDWILPALARHADGALLREAGGVNEWHAGGAMKEKAHFALNLVAEHDVRKAVIAEDTANALMRAVREEKPLPASPARDWVEERLNFRYAMHGLADIPAKLTVSEIKRRFALLDAGDKSVPASFTLPEKRTEWRRPRFLQGEKGLSSTERGTIVHTVMQNLDLSSDTSFEGIRNQVERMAERGIIPFEHKNAVSIKGIADFARSPIGKRMRRAVRVMREIPFSRMVQAKRFFDTVENAKECVFIQGVLDVLFEDENGQLVLLDYKTDQTNDEARLRHRYAVQIALYAESIEEILGRKIAERYLYLLQHSTFISMGMDPSVENYALT